MAVVTPVRIRDWTLFGRVAMHLQWLFASRGRITVVVHLTRTRARLAQLVERQPFKLVVVGSSPTVGALLLMSESACGVSSYSGGFAEGPHGVMDNALDF